MDLKKMRQVYGFLFGEKAVKSRQNCIMLPFLLIKRNLSIWKRRSMKHFMKK